jgi:hypothetical protein
MLGPVSHEAALCSEAALVRNGADAGISSVRLKTPGGVISASYTWISSVPARHGTQMQTKVAVKDRRSAY